MMTDNPIDETTEPEVPAAVPVATDGGFAVVEALRLLAANTKEFKARVRTLHNMTLGIAKDREKLGRERAEFVASCAKRAEIAAEREKAVTAFATAREQVARLENHQALKERIQQLEGRKLMAVGSSGLVRDLSPGWEDIPVSDPFLVPPDVTLTKEPEVVRQPRGRLSRAAP
jgi:hypothetical protein